MKRRDFLTLSVKAAMAAGYTSAIPASLLYSHNTHAAILSAGLSNPAKQPLFTNLAPNAMAAAFKYVPKNNKLKITAAQAVQMTGLVDPDGSVGEADRHMTTRQQNPGRRRQTAARCRAP